MAYTLTRTSSQRFTASLPSPSGVVSVSMWIKPASVPGTYPNRHGLWARTNISTQGYYAYLSAWDLQVGFHNGSGYEQISGATGGATDTWMQVGAVYDWSGATYTLKTITNGTVTNTGTGTTGTPNTEFDQTFLGCVYGSGPGYECFDGAIAEVGVWDRELTTAEWNALADGFSPARVGSTDLVRYWPLLRDAQEIRTSSAVSAVNTPTVSAHCRVYK